MSHFTRVKTQLRDMEVVKRALADLGYIVGEGEVRGYANQVATAEFVVKMDGGFDIGFRKDNGLVTMVADMWGLKINRDEFLSKLAQRYAYLTILDQAAQQGWQVAGEEIQEDGSVRLVMQRWN